MSDSARRISREFRVRFAQIDSAHVIFYPRYLEIIAETFPEARMDRSPFSMVVRFLQSNRLGDDLLLHLDIDDDGWTATGEMQRQHFVVVKADGVAELAATPTSATSFVSPERVIGDWQCDSNGRLHLSRYYELISETVEQWFETSLGMSFHELHIQRSLGIPTVQFDTAVQALPGRGEPVAMRLAPINVGGAALQLLHSLESAGEVLAQTRQVIVFVELNDDKIRPVPIPESLRTLLEAQLAASANR